MVKNETNQDQTLEALAAWDRLEPLLHFASELHGSLPSGHLARTVRLREAPGLAVLLAVVWEMYEDSNGDIMGI